MGSAERWGQALPFASFADASLTPRLVARGVVASRELLPRFDQIDILAQQLVHQFGEFHPVLGGAPGEIVLHLAIEVDRELELGARAVELPAHPFAEIVFVSHRFTF